MGLLQIGSAPDWTSPGDQSCGVASRLRGRAAGSDRRLQFLQFHFQIFVRHDERLDGAAQVAIAHRDRLVAGLFVAAIVESGGRGKGNAPGGAPNKAHGKAPDSKMGGEACSLFVLPKSRDTQVKGHPSQGTPKSRDTQVKGQRVTRLT